MTDLPTIAFIGLPLLTGGIGIGLGVWWQAGNEGYWKAIAEREEKRATANHRKFVGAAKECNAIADSNARLAKTLRPKPEYRNRRLAQFSPERRNAYWEAVAGL